MTTSSEKSYHPLILASGSRYRAELLGRLGLEFTQVAAAIDESALPGENPADLATRLARAKAGRVARDASAATIIGSDQVATVDGALLGKPNTIEAAHRQLGECSGKRSTFLTAVCVISPSLPEPVEHVDETVVVFRDLTTTDITRYVAREPALDCAGGFKAEALGISLFREITTRDPTALTGLPLIWLAAALRRCGYRLP